MLKRTVLFEEHQKLGGRLVEFGGWEMPVQYSSIVDEHLCVRRAAGIFDIAHMGEVFVSGSGAEAFLNGAFTNDVRKLTPGTGQYTLMCRDDGGVVDDLYLYRIGAEEFLVIVNASRIESDCAHLSALWARQPEGVALDNASGRWGAVALQGPRVAGYVDSLFPGASSGGWIAATPTALRKNQIALWEFEGRPAWVARTGYTGEDGFEVVAPAEVLPALWRRVLAAGHPVCQQPCGLGARDTLRTEMCYPLYGHELSEAITPFEAGLGFFVAMGKGFFVGRAALEAQAAAGLTRKLAAFRMTEKSAPPRPGYPIWADGAVCGEVTSGTQSPSLQTGVGMGLVHPGRAAVGTALEIEIRGRKSRAEVVQKPIYRKA